MSNYKTEAGNAVVEFIAFGLLALAPISVFAVTQTQVWVAKARVESAATQLARAASLGSPQFSALAQELTLRTPGLVADLVSENCCVVVHAELQGQLATARQVK